MLWNWNLRGTQEEWKNVGHTTSNFFFAAWIINFTRSVATENKHMFYWIKGRLRRRQRESRTNDFTEPLCTSFNVRLYWGDRGERRRGVSMEACVFLRHRRIVRKATSYELKWLHAFWARVTGERNGPRLVCSLFLPKNRAKGMRTGTAYSLLSCFSGAGLNLMAHPRWFSNLEKLAPDSQAGDRNCAGLSR